MDAATARVGGEKIRVQDVPRTLDPELAALATLIPTINLQDVVLARDMERVISSEMRHSPIDGVQREDFEIIRPDGSLLKISLHRPSGGPRRSPFPVLLFFHGGSFVMGGLHTEESRCEYYAHAVGCCVISVEYRLAPEHPYPAALDDCVLALHWASNAADWLGLDGRRVALGGLSAGGALAAAIALWCRDRDDHSLTLPSGGILAKAFARRPRPLLQLLLHPVLDASLSTHSAMTYDDTPIITAEHIAQMWRLYLGDSYSGTDVPVLASPSHARDLRRLPPAYVCTSQYDPLRDECVQFAQRLIDADVPVDFKHYARAFHSFDSLSASRMGRKELAAQVDALATAFR